ncbi:hypothetical protein JCM15548_247 [Geofilum rubicundum JCM 15548]|uniref:Gingipain domain-containing protein n=2 Tax=Geofilum TaxID=1236988 RepID=A0A0E9LSB2_9BACT|nr:hypothetical protein JCM15548_247 [Geofilum rubicundum JCM 15548]
MLPFEGEGYWKNGLPVHLFSTPLPANVIPGSIEVAIEEATWEAYPLFQSDERISSQPILSHALTVIQKRNILEIALSPIRKKEGVSERIKEVSLKVSYQTNPKKSTSSANYTDQSVLSSGQWTKIAISQTGIYKIPYSTLQSWGFSQPSNVSVFGYGGQMVPRENAASRHDDLPQVGVWHHNNAVYFYGHGPASWHWNADKSLFLHQIHIWSNQAYYFITDSQGSTNNIEPLETVTQEATQNVYQYDFRAYHENEKENLIKSGRKWFGESFQSGTPEHTFSFPSPDRDQSSPVSLFAAVAGRSATVNTFRFLVNNQSSPSLTLNVPPVNMGSYESFYAQEQSGYSSFLMDGNDLEIKVRYMDQDSNSKGWLDYLTINSRNSLKLSGHELHFRDSRSVGADQITQFTLANAKETTVVWDVTNLTNPKRAQVNYANNALTFKAKTQEIREYVAFNPEGSFPVPSRVETLTNQNLHAIDQAHYVIVAPEEFWPQAQELAGLHQTHNNLNSVIVSPEQIYNEFSWGHTDPTAIRSFMRMLYEKNGTNSDQIPRYLLLFGHGSYDSRTEDPRRKSLIITYQSENSIHVTNSYVTDDYFGFLDASEGADDRYDRLDIGIGRFPVRNKEQATVAVEKVRRYLENQDTGDWRKLITFLADDGDYNIHMRDADFLAEKVETNYPFNTRKIYLDSYPKTSSTSGDRSPEAEDLVERTVSEGTLLFNYVGHGSTNSLTAEQVITATSVSNWTNNRKLPLFVTATCEFSRYDHPVEVSAGEKLFLNSKGGGIALLTTTRVVYSSLNFQLNNSFFNRVFETNEQGERSSLGNIIMNTKNNAGSSVNKLNFSLLGDPALKMIYPHAGVKTTAINHKPVEQESDTLRALSKPHIQGEIIDNNGLKMDTFNGEIDVVVYDKLLELSTLGNATATPFQYSQYANILFKGTATVSNGAFELEFMVPYDIRYNYAPGKISYYARSESSGEAFGSFKDFIVGGFDMNATEDTQGPEINLYLNHPDFKAGDLTGARPLLYASIFDESGINTSGNGIGHDITLIINDNTNNPIVLNEYFEAKPDDFREGMVIFQMPQLEPGRYDITVKAWDTFNNSSTEFSHFVVGTGTDLSIRDFKWYPNPITGNSTGYFSFQTDDPAVALSIVAEAISSGGATLGQQKMETVAEGNFVQPIPLSLQSLGIGSSGIYFIRFQIKANNGKETQMVQKIMVRP